MMGNNKSSKIFGISKVKIKIFDETVEHLARSDMFQV